MKNFTLVSVIFLIAFSNAFCQNTLADAQKAYVKGDWKTAAQAFEMACPKEPKEKQDECFLWNILALSQIGDAKSFKVAGKKLDSLIANTNPQKDIYADLLMTSAQFRMYLGKYDKAAEDLVRAIENSKPKHATVLLKVCDAIRAKSNLQNLVERCEELKNPEAKPPVKATEDSSKNAAIIRGKSAEAVALNAPQKTGENPADTVAVKPEKALTDSLKKENAAPIALAEIPKTEVKKETEKISAKDSSAEIPTTKEYWILQLGAFGTKSNAELLVSNLKKQKIICEIFEQPRGEKILYLVQTGHFESRENAVDFAAEKLSPLKIEYQPLLRK